MPLFFVIFNQYYPKWGKFFYTKMYLAKLLQASTDFNRIERNLVAGCPVSNNWQLTHLAEVWFQTVLYLFYQFHKPLNR